MWRGLTILCVRLRVSGVSQHPWRQGHGLTGVCSGLQSSSSSSTMCPFRPGRRQPRYPRTPVRNGSGGWSSQGTSSFHCDYKGRHNYDCISVNRLCDLLMGSCPLVVVQIELVNSFLCKEISLTTQAKNCV